MTSPHPTLRRLAALCALATLCAPVCALAPARAWAQDDSPTADTPDAAPLNAPLPDAPAVLAPPVPAPAPAPAGERMAYGGFQAVPPAPSDPYADLEIAGLSVLLIGGITTITGAILWAQGYNTAGPITAGVGAGTSAVGVSLLYIDSRDQRPASAEPQPASTSDAQTLWIGWRASF